MVIDRQRIQRMREVLTHAYDHPDQPAVFYSANGAPTGSVRLNAMDCWDWSVVPAFAPKGSATSLVPITFGCPPCRMDDGREWMSPMITDAAQVKDLPIPDVWTGRAGEILREMKQLCAELPPEGQVRAPDIQSPLGIAELMWDESFYVALLEEPAAVHALLEKITTFLIAFVNEVHRVCGDRLNAVCFPPVWADSKGTMVADDTMTLVSPSMHREFSVPYLNRFADACGPLYYHSCSWRKQYFDNIRAVRHVKAYNWNPGNSDDPATIIKEFGGQAVLAPHLLADMHKDRELLDAGLRFEDEVALLRHMLDAAQSNTCLMFWFSNVVQKGPVMERIYDLLHERGHTPQARLTR